MLGGKKREWVLEVFDGVIFGWVGTEWTVAVKPFVVCVERRINALLQLELELLPLV